MFSGCSKVNAFNVSVPICPSAKSTFTCSPCRRLRLEFRELVLPLSVSQPSAPQEVPRNLRLLLLLISPVAGSVGQVNYCRRYFHLAGSNWNLGGSPTISKPRFFCSLAPRAHPQPILSWPDPRAETILNMRWVVALVISDIQGPGNPSSCRLRPAESRQEHCCKNANNRNHHQQLDQCKGVLFYAFEVVKPCQKPRLTVVFWQLCFAPAAETGGSPRRRQLRG